VTLANTGARDGATVVQVYGGLPTSSVDRPERRLIGFARVEVPAATTVEVDVDLDLRQLDVRRHRDWVTEGGDYTITAGLHSLDPHAATAHLQQPGV
jgi:beta-glucosidase